MKLKIFLIFKFTKSMINNKGKRHKKKPQKEGFIHLCEFILFGCSKPGRSRNFEPFGGKFGWLIGMDIGKGFIRIGSNKIG